jgi:DNA ligase-1
MKPMLAKSFKASWLKFPIYLQPKLDGCRAIWTGSKLLSRTGKEIKGVPALVDHLQKNYSDFPLDGELYNHKKTFQELISSIRRTVNIEEDLDVEYHIYDLPLEQTWTFQERLNLLKEKVIVTSRIKIVETVYIPLEGNEILNILPGLVEKEDLNTFEAQGYEGTMVRNAMGLYRKGKRSSDLMKVKTFQDAEFPIVGVYQLSRKEKIIVPEGTPGALQYADGTWYKDGVETPDEMLGGLVLSIPGTDKTFECGTGYNEATRCELWANSPIGKVATIKFQELTDDGVPRFPVFLAIRDYE